MDAGENQAYKDMVLTYIGDIIAEKALEFDNEEFRALEFCTRGYGISMYYYFNNDIDKSRDLFNKVYKEESAWNSFGYMATYQEKKKKY